jgi:hypothetical protein
VTTHAALLVKPMVTGPAHKEVRNAETEYRHNKVQEDAAELHATLR